jgi:hypothetical protein
MKRIGIIQHENYEPDKLDKIFKTIELASKNNQEKFYEVALDGYKIIPRTSDPEKFHSFSEFIEINSECLTLYVYYGASKQYDTYFFYFKAVPANKAKTRCVSGNLNVEEFEKQQRDRIAKELYYERLEQENEELKSQLQESEEKFRTQQEHWDNIKNGKVASYGEIGSSVLMSLITNPTVRKMFPALNKLGDIEQVLQGTTTENESKDNTTQEENEGATFKRKTPAQPQADNNIQLSEQDKKYVTFFKDLAQKFNEQQIQYMMNIIRLLRQNPLALKSTYKHIQNFLKGKPQA